MEVAEEDSHEERSVRNLEDHLTVRGDPLDFRLELTGGEMVPEANLELAG